MIKFITQDERNLKKEIMDDAEKRILLDQPHWNCWITYLAFITFGGTLNYAPRVRG